MPNLSNGILCFGPSIFVSVAFCLSLTSSALCNFLELDDDNRRRLGIFEVRSIGFWCYEGLNGSRYEYRGDLDNFDSAFERARSFGLVANIVGFVAWLVYLFAGCIPFPPLVFIFTGFLCLAACLFEGLKFTLKDSDIFCDGPDLGCGIDTAGRVAISACVFWFVSALMTCAHGKERMDADSDRDADAAPEPEDPNDKERMDANSDRDADAAPEPEVQAEVSVEDKGDVEVDAA